MAESGIVAKGGIIVVLDVMMVESAALPPSAGKGLGRGEGAKVTGVGECMSLAGMDKLSKSRLQSL